MKRGFTLLELIVVIIILGVLATLGLSQYGAMVEKSRSAEAKAILGDIRSFAAAYRMEKNNSLLGVTAEQLNLGTTANMIPTACAGTHYFSYTFSSVTADGLTITANRCTSGGKAPTGAISSIALATNLSTGVDSWTP